MERVVIIGKNFHCLSNEESVEVNRYLECGWTIKDIKTVNTKDHMSVIFVLEKK